MTANIDDRCQPRNGTSIRLTAPSITKSSHPQQRHPGPDTITEETTSENPDWHELPT